MTNGLWIIYSVVFVSVAVFVAATHSINNAAVTENNWLHYVDGVVCLLVLCHLQLYDLFPLVRLTCSIQIFYSFTISSLSLFTVESRENERNMSDELARR